MQEKIIIAGFGGQGIMFLGKLICQSGMEEGFYVTYFPSYGAEVRGGTANCHAILSDNPIASPVIGKATALIIMNEPSLIKYESSLIKGGLLILNSSLVKIEPRRRDIKIEKAPATDLAYEVGDVRTANIVMFGRYIACRGLIKRESVVKNIKGSLAELNIKAFEAGFNK